MTDNKDHDESNLISIGERLRSESREFLLGLADKIEAEDRMTRLWKTCMHLTIQSALIGFDDALPEATQIAAMGVLSKAAADLAKLGGFPVPPLNTPEST